MYFDALNQSYSHFWNHPFGHRFHAPLCHAPPSTKVYMPCILQTKKRYVGFAYESLDQKEPTFDAKGIETVRRDGCPAVAKVSGWFVINPH